VLNKLFDTSHQPPSAIESSPLTSAPRDADASRAAVDMSSPRSALACAPGMAPPSFESASRAMSSYAAARWFWPLAFQKVCASDVDSWTRSSLVVESTSPR
jgi:hypothetical protein